MNLLCPGNKIKFLFAASIILMLGSHALLPHHHHYDSHYSHEYPLPAESNHDHSKPDSPDYHCHAFNDLLDDGYQHKLIQLIKYQPLVAPTISENFPFIPRDIKSKWEIPDVRLVPQGYDRSYSLRDPPVFS